MLVPDIARKENLKPSHSIAIFGSTGSIGKSTLEIVKQAGDRFKIEALVANRNIEQLAAQANLFLPKIIACNSELRSDLAKLVKFKGCEIITSDEACDVIARMSSIDTVVAAIVGIAGLRSVLAAIKYNKRVALANKESIVAGGALVSSALKSSTGLLIPVDSEHSAIFQALQGISANEISKLILTASGGPFLDTPVTDLGSITPQEAIKHPKWSMGAKISIDSATLMNKGLELIEAAWLFGIDESKIEVIIHPQSIIHSAVETHDGSIIAQASSPDMRIPIAYALTYPGQRVKGVVRPMNLAEIGKLEFRALDNHKFKAIALARSALQAGTGAQAIFNIANEIAVEDFLTSRIKFDKIVANVESALDHFGSPKIECVDDIEELVKLLRSKQV